MKTGGALGIINDRTPRARRWSNRGVNKTKRAIGTIKAATLTRKASTAAMKNAPQTSGHCAEYG